MGETKRISAKDASSRQTIARRSAGIAAAALVIFSPFVELSPVFATTNDSAYAAAGKKVAEYVSNKGIFAAMKANDSAKSKDTAPILWNTGGVSPTNSVSVPKKTEPTPDTMGYTDPGLYLADSLFENAGIYALGAREKKAAESITWLVSSNLNQHGIDSTVELYFTAMGVNRKSILLLGRVADEMRSDGEAVLSGSLMRYLKFKKGDPKKGLRPIPHSVFYVAVSLENAEKMPRRFIIGHPSKSAPAVQISSLDSMFIAQTDTVPIIAAASVAAPKPPAAVKKPVVARAHVTHRSVHTIYISPPAEVKAEKEVPVAIAASKPPEIDYSNIPECMRHLYLAGLAGAGAAVILLMGMAGSFTGQKRRRHKLAMDALAAHAESRKQRISHSIL